MTEPSTANTKMRISRLYTYPIKSMRGCTPTSLTATATGLAHDRRFMLIRAQDSKNMHVTYFPEMCLFTTELSPPDDPKTVLVRYTKEHVFDRPEEKVEDEPLEVELEPEYTSLETVEMEMHSSGTVGYGMGRRCDEWFSKRFGYEVRLLYLGDGKRKVLGNLSPNSMSNKEAENKAGGDGWFGWTTAVATNIVGKVIGSSDSKENSVGEEYKGVDTGIGFADCAPFLVINTRSWENASRRLDGEEMDISKFRANIVLEGADEEFEEDFWAELHVSGQKGDARIMLTSNCARCASLNVDYNTGKVGTGESGAILKKLQKDRRVDKGAKWSPIFGRYGFLAQRPGTQAASEVKLQVGDSVEVVRRNAERTRFQWPKLSTDG